MIVTITGVQTFEPSWQPQSAPVLVGKDILELLSSAMYLEPLTVYREYVQNSADSIDEARRLGILSENRPGRVDIIFDSTARSVRIRDNGTGLNEDDFERRLTAFGASAKRGSQARGFRGVGRLAGIGYCQELIFRSRACGEAHILELGWDCRKIKAILRSKDSPTDLTNIVNQSVSVRKLGGKSWPEHFFEVEMRNVVRHGSDSLLNPAAIYDYLSQVAPVPFHTDFRFSNSILEALLPHVNLGHIQIRIEGVAALVSRPHRNRFELKAGCSDGFSEAEVVKIPAVDGGTAAIGWVLHHGYKGAIPLSNLKGFRLRSGNMQVGGNNTLEALFTETRFNSWAVGEVHVLDGRAIPNGRRDHFEQNVHFHNLINHLAPLAREISACCRRSSMKRNMLRRFASDEHHIRENLRIIRQGSLGLVDRKQVERRVRDFLRDMEQLASRALVTVQERRRLLSRLSDLSRQTKRAFGLHFQAVRLAGLPRYKRQAYEQVFGLIYECSSNSAVALKLVDRILRCLG